MMQSNRLKKGMRMGACVLGLTLGAQAQDNGQNQAAELDSRHGGAAIEAGSPQDAQRIAEREAAFAKLLTNSTLLGYFTDSNAHSDKLVSESYVLTSVTKAEGNLWTFAASWEFGGRSIPIAIKLPVEWAGDTPVIMVTNKMFPFIGTYSARVLFYDNQYVGVWGGAEHGGQMFGKVVPNAAAGKAAEQGHAEGAGEHEHGTGEGGHDQHEHGGDGGAAGGALGGSAAAYEALGDEGKHWPSFRGQRASGVAEGFATADEWDVEEGKNILWRVVVPGMSHSSPVVWGKQIFVTTAIRAEGEQETKFGLYGSIEGVPNEGAFAFALHCFDKESGQEIWNQVSWEGLPKGQRHPKGSYAAPSPACDGERVLAFYGQEGLFCYDMQGKLLWSKTFGELDSGYYLVKEAQWGFSSSPILHEGMAIIQCDVQEGSFLMAMDAATGKEIWRTERDEVPGWSTPTVVISEGRQQVVCNGYKHIGGYDLKTGKELWKLVGGGDIPVPTPILAQGLIFITNAHGNMAPIYAIDPAAEGTLAIKHDFVAWSERSRGNYMQTPLAYGEDIYFCSDAGVLACYDIASGELNYRERLGEGSTGFTGSGVAADGKLYFTSEQGEVFVILAGVDLEVIARNSLGEPCLSSPAISEGVLYYHTVGHLLAIK